MTAVLTDKIKEWQAKGLLNEKIKSPVTGNHSSSARLIWMNNSRRRVEYKARCFNQDKVTFSPKNVVN